MDVMRFNGKDNRSAMDQVRKTLGPDALILSNRRTSAGVEICATAELPDLSKARPAAAPVAKPAAPQAAKRPAGNDINEVSLAQLKRELAGLRETLQQALGERQWQDSAGKRPVIATIEQRLATLGIGREIAGQLTSGLSKQADLNSAWASTLHELVGGLDCLTTAELDGLRVKAVIGAPGSGKSAAASALMTAALKRMQASDIAVVSFAASALTDPLAMRCEETGIRYLAAKDRKSLSKALSECAWAREIIIDTPAIDVSKGSQDRVLTALNGQRAGLTALMMVPATLQRDYLLRLGAHVDSLPIAGAVISKLDQAVSMGPVLDLVLGCQLPIAGTLNSEKESIISLSPQELIQKTKALARNTLQSRAKQLKVAV